jgi:hypothetical protein
VSRAPSANAEHDVADDSATLEQAACLGGLLERELAGDHGSDPPLLEQGEQRGPVIPEVPIVS